jgi:hypothetical protein
MHAVLENISGAWVVRDLGSTNGTFVGTSRVEGSLALAPGDVITVGDSRISIDMGGDALADRTEVDHPVARPLLTPREQEVLDALCAPLLRGAAMALPATAEEIAKELHVGVDSIKKYLNRLADKFGTETGRHRSLRLARTAFAAGAVRGAR